MARAQMRWISCQFTIALCIVTVTLPQVVPASGAARDVTVDAVRFLGKRSSYLCFFGVLVWVQGFPQPGAVESNGRGIIGVRREKHKRSLSKRFVDSLSSCDLSLCLSVCNPWAEAMVFILALDVSQPEADLSRRLARFLGRCLATLHYHRANLTKPLWHFFFAGFQRKHYLRSEMVCTCSNVLTERKQRRGVENISLALLLPNLWLHPQYWYASCLNHMQIPAREGWHVTVWQDSPLQDPELSLDESSSEANLVEGRELFEFAADYEKPCANKKHDPSVCKNG